MSQTILFIHGTGVREPAFTETFGKVQRALNERLTASRVHVEPCYWGGTCGSKLYLNGISIPEADTTRAGGDLTDDEPDPAALWAWLDADPYAELELLALSVGKEVDPGPGPPAGEDLYHAVQTLSADPASLEAGRRQELAVLLAAAGITPQNFETARAELLGGHAKMIQSAPEPLGIYRLAIARALLARAAQFRPEDNFTAGVGGLTITQAERVAVLLADAMGGQEMSAVAARIGGLVKRVTTGWVRRRRGRYSDMAAAVAADIIFYQTRPTAIQAFVRSALHKAADSARARGESGILSVIAHSLGGVAVVDTLMKQPMPEVTHLITVGSQVPLLYELDALQGRPLQRDPSNAPMPPPHPLPGPFPTWLNIFDARDFLSYRAQPVFGDTSVRDLAVDNGCYFPESHSAYWANPKVWDIITSTLAAGATP